MPLDHTLPDGKWTFGEAVTTVFDNMLERSIPQYALMRQACADLARGYVQPETAIIDLGCARGEALAPLVEAFSEQNQFIGVEVSPPMVTAARARFQDHPSVEIRSLDLRQEYPPEPASVVLCILTLQFIPMEYRPALIQQIADCLLPGGALLLVEKVLGASASLDRLFVERYLALKAKNGYSPEEIERKRLSLEGVLVPVTARWNEELLQTAGFRQVDCFWRWMNFAGWMALK